MMKNYKSILLASAAILVSLSSSSLNAVKPDDVIGEIHAFRTCPPVAKEIKAEDKGWFSSVRNPAGNGLRCFGDWLRTEGNPRTPAGLLKEKAKEAASFAASAKTGLPISTAIFNPLGNAMRWAGQRFKGGEETQTENRVIANNLGLKRSSTHAEIAEGLRVAVTAILKTNKQKAPEQYLEIVKILNNRGISTKALDAQRIFVDAVAMDVLQENETISFAEFSTTMRAQCFSSGGMQRLPNAIDLESNDHLEQLYKVAKAKVSLQRQRAA